MLVVSFMVGIYYNMIISWTLYYFFASMTKNLPWETCEAAYNTPLCASVRGQTAGSNQTLVHEFVSSQDTNFTMTGLNSSYLNQSWVMYDSYIGTEMEDYGVTCVKEPSLDTVSCTLTSYPLQDLCTSLCYIIYSHYIVLSLCTLTIQYSHYTVLSLYSTLTMYSHYILSLYTLTMYSHYILSLYTLTIYSL